MTPADGTARFGAAKSLAFFEKRVLRALKGGIGRLSRLGQGAAFGPDPFRRLRGCRRRLVRPPARKSLKKAIDGRFDRPYMALHRRGTALPIPVCVFLIGNPIAPVQGVGDVSAL